VIIPDGQDENHTVSQSLAHLRETAIMFSSLKDANMNASRSLPANSLEVVSVTKRSLLGRAEVSGDRIGSSNASLVGVCILDDFAVLNVDAADLRECAGGCTRVGDELGDDSDNTVGVNSETRAEEGLIAQTPGVVVTTIFVAVARVTGGSTQSSAPIMVWLI
jgi:hypothetical protein